MGLLAWAGRALVKGIKYAVTHPGQVASTVKGISDVSSALSSNDGYDYEDYEQPQALPEHTSEGVTQEDTEQFQQLLNEITQAIGELKAQNDEAIQNLAKKAEDDIAALKNELVEISKQHDALKAENEEAIQNLAKKTEDDIAALKAEIEKLNDLAEDSEKHLMLIGRKQLQYEESVNCHIKEVQKKFANITAQVQASNKKATISLIAACAMGVVSIILAILL